MLEINFLPIHLGHDDLVIPLNANDAHIFRGGTMQHASKVKIK